MNCDGLQDSKKRKTDQMLEEVDDICSPICDLANLWTYTLNYPAWTNQIMDLTPRSNLVVKNSHSNCHVESSLFSSDNRLDRHTVPHTLVCHDMKGGYLDDKYVKPVNCGNGYTFYRWAQIDLFVYFSHNLVTIPPLAWINIAHTNGVKILGTFITECIPGEEICREILKNNESINKLVDILVNICIKMKLDGWLLNIENKVENVESLERFVSTLTQQLHINKPGTLVIWYDSVISDGTLKWQNELNGLNKCFFNICDGIFLNYSWTENNLRNTVEIAQHRCLDVYVGVDVFGRRFYEGGNFNTYKAVEKIREYNLSIAIFAQGWTHETLTPEPTDTLLERFLNRDNAFWKSLWPYLYTHPIVKTFQTFFYTGVDKNWFNLQSQEIQLSRFLHPQICHPEYQDVQSLTGNCKCLKLVISDNYTSCLISKENLDQTKMYIHHLFSCDINLTGKIIFYYYSKKLDNFNIVLLINNNNDSFKKIICYPCDRRNFIDNCSILEISPLQNKDHISMVSKEHKTPPDCTLRCYLLNLEHCRVLEVGAEISNSDNVCLFGIGFKSLTSIKR